MSWHIAVSDTKVFAFLGVYYRQVYSPNRQRGRNQKKLRSHSMISLEYLEEKSYWILISLFCLQDGRRYAKKTEVFISSTENKESTMNDDVLRHTEVDMSPIYSRT